MAAITAWSALRELFVERAIQFGEFTLASSQKSKYYINSKKVLLHPKGLSLLGELLADTLAGEKFNAIGGLEAGAIPMVSAVLKGFYDRERYDVEGFFVRKQAKQHGSQSLIEGTVNKGDRVVILDDVLTTGNSALAAIRAVEAAGAYVIRVICICDRKQGARDLLSNYDFRPLFTVKDFGLEPEKN